MNALNLQKHNNIRLLENAFVCLIFHIFKLYVANRQTLFKINDSLTAQSMGRHAIMQL